MTDTDNEQIRQAPVETPDLPDIKVANGPRFGKRVLVCAAVLLAGVVAMGALISLRKAPAAAVQQEQTLSVEVVEAYPETAQVWLQSFGEVRSLNEVRIAPEVAGRVVEIHPRLEPGEVIPRGETLFVIDPRDYKARLAEAKASIGQIENTLERLVAEEKNYRSRLSTSRRSLKLAQDEFERIKTLFEEDQVGARSNVDAAERALNQQRDQVDQLERAVDTYPMQIEEAKNGLDAARARMEMASLSVERTHVTAPFDARLTMVNVETDQYVSPGNPVLVMADDSVLEIAAPLDSREARQWLQFDQGVRAREMAWFASVKPVDVTVRWTEDKAGHTWTGRLHRVIAFDQNTRTLTVAIRVTGAEASSGTPTAGEVEGVDASLDSRGLPLVDGMFCEVLIPGRDMDDVFRLPRWAVTFENEAYLAVDDRLRKVTVDVARTQGNDVFVSGGLDPGDLVITTRLSNPLENTLLEVNTDEKEPASS